MTDRPDRLLRAAAVANAVAIAVHFADHLRRGVDASPKAVVALGLLALVFQAAAIVAALTGRAYAPLLAVAVALPDAIGVAAVHLLPRWSALSDAFPGPGAAPGVTALSWASGVAEIATGLVFAYAGWVAVRARGAAPSVLATASGRDPHQAGDQRG